jgi:UDP-N-acetylmuramoyl-L-alanyl-D-glutamate--2,6-diaminopimelate ligase
MIFLNQMINFKKKLKTVWWRGKSIGARYYYGNPSKKLKIIGVTGTNGKTTTATLLYEIAIALGYKAGLISTVENIINGKIVFNKEGKTIPGTTPDSVTLTKLFRKMVDEGCEYVFMEVSSHALDQNRVWGVNFVGGIFTNLTHDHLDYHKTFENYFAAKKKFFQMLPREAFALSNTDNEYGLKMLEGIQAKKFTYGFNTPSASGTSPLARGRKGGGLDLDFSEKLETKLIGEFNLYNTLAVYASAVLLGFDKEKVIDVLKTITPPKGRFEHFMSPGGVLVIVDYAHTPDALENVLQTIQKMRKENSKIISVFGCGGDRDPMKRKIMGNIGATLSDVAIFTSDNPRSEDPDKIIEQMKEGLSSEMLQKVKTISNRHEAIKEAVKLAQKGDIILCAGKGHEDYQEIKGVKHHFDDMEEFKKLYQV